MVIRRQALLALFLVMGILGLGVLACTSDQTWIIPRTATPTATVTPPPTPDLDTDFNVGDRVRLVGAMQLFTTVDPDPSSIRAAPCFGNTVEEVLGVAEFEGVIYYRVNCGSAPGWISEQYVEAEN